ncbi:MAG: HAMP domain-containing protein [Burkholderiales bacterium]|jgi:nitrogen fixation/metabolism regulation signal transduction histidine kinase|nr:HAMP domain-containing protein [Burkholderiales bacterium]
MTLWSTARRKRWSLLLVSCLAAAALFLLVSASANTPFFERNYKWLLALNGALIITLMVIVSRQLYKLWRSYHTGVFGARLAVRLMLMGALVALLPGALVYAVSVASIDRSIESWFDVRVDRALEGGMNVSRSTLDERLADTVGKARQIANHLQESSLYYGFALNRAAEMTGVDEAAIYTPVGVLIAVGGTHPSLATPSPPSPKILEDLRNRLIEVYAKPEQEENDLRLRVVLPLETNELNDAVRFLQVIDMVPATLAADIETVQSGWQDYKEISFSRKWVKRLYTLTLTMTLLLTLTIALGMAVVLAERFAAPLGLLAEGTQAVAGGNFGIRQPVTSRDEMGSLTESFNAMTAQLEQAQRERERNHQALETTRAYLESVLSNLSSGVLVFDEWLQLRTANHSATVILQSPLAELEGTALTRWAARQPALAPFAELLIHHISPALNEQWHQETEIRIADTARTLLVRGTRLSGPPLSYVVVFDDVSVVVQAQRDAAWSEVARRLAHEIKNPLTPIQLSAERLAMKLSDKLDDADQDVLVRGTLTIVSQVAAMKQMVDDFATYARQPRPGQLTDFDVVALLNEVLALYDHLQPHLQLILPDAPVILHGEANRLRQVFHNLFQNAADAQADNAAPGYRVSLSVEGEEAHLSVCDDGPGFTEEVLARAFEPYVTTKAKGTGLGLAIVKKIIEEHGGRVMLANKAPHGGKITLVLPVTSDVRMQP